MDFAKLIARAKAILLSPRTEWPVIAAEPETVANLYKNYILVLAAIPAIAGFIKGSLIGFSLFGITVRTPMVSGIIGMLVSYALTLGIVYLVALIIDALAPSFGGEKNIVQALKTSAYTYTASWVAGIATIIPWIGWLVVLAGAIYGIYLLYVGLPHTMRSPPDKSVGYTAVVIVIGFVLSIVVGMVVGGITAAGSAASALSMGTSTSSSVTVDTDSALGKLAALGQKMEQQGKKMEAAEKSGDSNAQAEAATAMLGSMLGGGDQVEALPPDAIKPFLPEKLAGFKRSSISVERNGAMGVQVSTGHASYRDADNNELQLEVTDMGGAKGIMALAGFAGIESEKQTEYGYEKTYKQDGRLVNERWDSNSHSGEFGIILGDRFSVKLSGNGEGLDMAVLKSALTSLDLAGLESLKNQGVKQG
ncbi:MAG TPA: Yip1 family protein [Dokdonella sp.]|uniref:Yip1 family protein n=3 Tax=Dokdonella sp. TaxID=2291710 RepID=UPI002C872825|nr:Yip1 family protein [Dokdonella sp.]HOX70534.1 Yip1 family protein [Dokdonella sp.]HPG93807.1 Yip1 family protein [Dokdonella sp.]